MAMWKVRFWHCWGNAEPKRMEPAEAEESAAMDALASAMHGGYFKPLHCGRG